MRSPSASSPSRAGAGRRGRDGPRRPLSRNHFDRNLTRVMAILHLGGEGTSDPSSGKPTHGSPATPSGGFTRSGWKKASAGRAKPRPGRGMERPGRNPPPNASVEVVDVRLGARDAADDGAVVSAAAVERGLRPERHVAEQTDVQRAPAGAQVGRH